MKLLILLITILLAVSAFGQTVQETNQDSNKLNSLFVQFFEEYLKLNPVLATSIGEHRYDDQYPDDISEEYRAQEKTLYSRYLSEISKFDRNRLTEQDRLSFDVFKFQMQIGLERHKYNSHLTPVNQFGDNTISFAQLGAGKGNHPFKTVKNYDDFLSRMRGFQTWVNTAIENMRRGMKIGVVQPRVLMERKLPQLEALLVADRTKSIFYQPVANMPADFSSADKARLTESYAKAINEIVLPSYRKLYEFIKNEYLPKTRATVGLSAIPGGREQYAYQVRAITTTDLTPEAIHRIGLDEVRRVRGEMEKVRQQVGFKGDLKAFFEYVRTDPKFYPFQTEEEVLNGYRKIEAKIQPTLMKYFGIVPKSKFEVRATEQFRAAGASEEYNRPDPNGARPGIFYVPVPDPRIYQSIRMESLFLHEAIPGHHYQISLQQEQRNLPKFRQFGGNSAFVEGWALYTESLGKELGLYGDPFQYFGMLTQEMHRAVRLVVDTGMHSKGWTREQAIAFSLENEPLTEARIAAEVERYIAWAGQALAYKIGQLKISELRRKAERELGSKFNIKSFHDEILKDGALPLNVLETKINEWITRQKTNAGS